MINENNFDTDVAIIGYGPSGVTAALALGKLGVNAIAFERDHDIYQRARAVTVSDWTMRCFQSVGLDDDLANNMDNIAALSWVTYAGDEIMRMEIPPSTIGKHPRSYSIYQPVMEDTLRNGVERYRDHITVRYGVEVTAVSQDAEGVTVTTKNTETGEEVNTRARYALACDGGRSTTREKIGLELVGETRKINWVIIDGRVKRWWPNRNTLKFWSDKKRPVVDIPLALGNHRWEFPLEMHETQADFETEEQLWPLLESLGVTQDDIDIHQHAFYYHNVRYANKWREGKVFLLGDAAHLMPPWAGAGMQSGMRDAFNIAWKINAVLSGKLPESLLDTYETERAPNVKFYTEIAVQLGRVIQQQLSEEEQAALAPVPGEPPPIPPLMWPPTLQAGWLNGQVSSEGILGNMIPQPEVASSTGKFCLLDELLNDDFVLLGDGVNPATLLSDSEKQAWDALNAKYLTVLSTDVMGHGSDDVIDLKGVLLAWMRSFNTKAIAVRPDRFVMASESTGLAVPSL